MYLDEAVTTITEHEGRYDWMYLDTAGNVTVVCGMMLPSADAAVKLPFQHQSGWLAQPGDVAADWRRVKQMQHSMAATSYLCPTSLVLTDAVTSQLLNGTVTACDKEVTTLFPLYFAFPDAAKVALLDMIYNLGATTLSRVFTHLCDAVPMQDWLMAAARCHRLGISVERNQWTAEQFAGCCSLRRGA